MRVAVVAAAIAVLTLSSCTSVERLRDRPVDWSGHVRGDWRQIAECASGRLDSRLNHQLTTDAARGVATIKSGMDEEVSLRQGAGDRVVVEHRSPFMAATRDNSIVWAAITGCSRPL